MNFRIKYLCLTLPLILIGCGGSSGGGGGGSNDLVNTSSNESSLVVSDETMLGLLGDMSGVQASDVWDPNRPSINQCAAPYYEAVQGVYRGTVEVFDFRDEHCRWDVTLTLSRFYDFAFCEFDVTYSGTGTALPPGLLRDSSGELILDREGNPQPNEREQLVCVDFETTGEMRGPTHLDGDELFNLNFPIEAKYNLDREVDLVDGRGIVAAVFPAPDARSFVASVDFLLVGDNEVSFPETQVINPIWESSITKVSTDLGEPVN